MARENNSTFEKIIRKKGQSEEAGQLAGRRGAKGARRQARQAKAQEQEQLTAVGPAAAEANQGLPGPDQAKPARSAEQIKAEKDSAKEYFNRLAGKANDYAEYFSGGNNQRARQELARLKQQLASDALDKMEQANSSLAKLNASWRQEIIEKKYPQPQALRNKFTNSEDLKISYSLNKEIRRKLEQLGDPGVLAEVEQELKAIYKLPLLISSDLKYKVSQLKELRDYVDDHLDYAASLAGEVETDQAGADQPGRGETALGQGADKPSAAAVDQRPAEPVRPDQEAGKGESESVEQSPQAKLMNEWRESQVQASQANDEMTRVVKKFKKGQASQEEVAAAKNKWQGLYNKNKAYDSELAEQRRLKEKIDRYFQENFPLDEKEKFIKQHQDIINQADSLESLKQANQSLAGFKKTVEYFFNKTIKPVKINDLSGELAEKIWKGNIPLRKKAQFIDSQLNKITNQQPGRVFGFAAADYQAVKIKINDKLDDFKKQTLEKKLWHNIGTIVEERMPDLDAEHIRSGADLADLDKKWELRERGEDILELTDEVKEVALRPERPAGGELAPVELTDQARDIPELIRQQFKEKFNINQADLEQIRNFDQLSAGQQLLVLENLKQLTLGRIEEEAAGQYRENTAKAKFLGRIWQGISKKYQIAKLKKARAEDIIGGGLTAHQRALEQLVNGLSQFGPAVAIRDGKLEIQYAKLYDSNWRRHTEEFNAVAGEFSRLPYEWSLDSAKRAERSRFNEVQKKYEQAKENILKLKVKEIGSQRAVQEMNRIEAHLKLNQFLNAHPEVEQELQKITDKKAWLKVLADTVTERGVYSGAGFLTRSVTMSAIGMAGLPVAAAITGGIFARRRAKETLKEQDRLARRGQASAGKQAKKFSRIKKVTDKINLLQNRLEDQGLNDRKRQAYEKALKLSVSWVEDKLNKGMINFGQSEDRLYGEYNLIQALAQGKAWAERYRLDDKYQERLNLAISERDNETEKARKKYVWAQTAKGAAYGAGFAAAGYYLRHLISDHPGRLKSKTGPAAESTAKSQAVKSGVGRQADKVVKLVAPPGQDFNQMTVRPDFSQAPNYFPSPEEVSPDFSQAPNYFPNPAEVKAGPAPAVMPDQATLELATIGKGQGIEHALIRQLRADPAEYGFKGDLNDQAAIKQWAGGEAHRLAIDNGYVDSGSGREIRVGSKGINRAAYVLEPDQAGKIRVHEYFKNDQGQFEPQETGSDAFAGQAKDDYEYIKEPKAGAATAAEQPVAEQPAAETGEREPAWIDMNQLTAADSEADIHQAALAEFNELAGQSGISPELAQQAGIDIFDQDGLSVADKEKLSWWAGHQDQITSAEQAGRIFRIADQSGQLKFDQIADHLPAVEALDNPVKQASLIELFINPNEQSKLGLFKNTEVLGHQRVREVIAVRRGDGELVLRYNIKNAPDFNLIIRPDGRALVQGLGLASGWSERFSSLKNLKQVLEWPLRALEEMERDNRELKM